MMHHIISTKELRENLPRVRVALSKGESYTLVYRSRPIATLEPIRDKPDNKVRVSGGTLRLQAVSEQPLTPEYLNKLAEDKYE
ncbi:hypothetical protein [Membranihabitans maritimus]|uniref:hypothetical protein n=1 Tax=Membranihabitans maritimus TaxID=2904244 RepID=UPI001F36FAE2|nr:hypothetical protein [Membranihabitans maritimus]